MDAGHIRQLQSELLEFLNRFSDCFERKDTRAHLSEYVVGQLSDIERKNVEAIALECGVPVRTLQEFLTQLVWHEGRMCDRLQETVAAEHPHPNSIGLIDETSALKKGDKTPGVQRQYLGCVGKQENGIVTVHLGYAAGDFHCLLDGELFLPQSWSEDRQRCAAAGIPEDMVYRPKTEIALELYDRAVANGIRFEWMTFDEWYGVKPQFLHALDRRGQKFVGEVHCQFVAWTEEPRVTTRRWRKRGRGRGRRTPRVVAGGSKARYVEDLLRVKAVLRDQAWQRFRVKDGAKGPLLWDVKHTTIFVKDENGLAVGPWHLLVCRNVLDPDEVKYFVSNAPLETPLEVLLLVAFSRWRVERCFKDQKGKIGLDHYEGRKYLGLKRHLILSAVSFLFLSRVRQRLAGEKSRVDSLPSAHGGIGAGAVLVAGPSGRSRPVRTGGQENQLGAKEERPGAKEPYKNQTTKTPRTRHQTHRNPTLSMEIKTDLAL